MRPTEEFIKRLQGLQEGERSRLRRLAGQPLDATVQGFDLFTGLWWPLRAQNSKAPRRETAWLVAKLYGAFPIPHVRPDAGEGRSLAAVLGWHEPSDPPDFKARDRFRARFDGVLCSSLPALEPHLRWALGEIARARDTEGIDWARLLDDLSVWGRGEAHRRRRDVRDEWAEDYLKSVQRTKPR